MASLFHIYYILKIEQKRKEWLPPSPPHITVDMYTFLNSLLVFILTCEEGLGYKSLLTGEGGANSNEET